jgi:hypothetical protein
MRVKRLSLLLFVPIGITSQEMWESGRFTDDLFFLSGGWDRKPLEMAGTAHAEGKMGGIIPF